MSVVDVLRHGTAGGYRRCRDDDGRRCARCRAAHAAYQREWAARQRPLDPRDPRHGTLNGYTNYRCGCDPCRAANRAKSRRRRRTP